MEKLPKIFLEQKTHRKENQLLIQFSYHKKLIALVRSIKGSYWSKSLNTWYIKYSQENLQTILTVFKDITIVDTSKLHKKELFTRNLTKEQKNLLNNFYLFFKRKTLQPKYY